MLRGRDLQWELDPQWALLLEIDTVEEKWPLHRTYQDREGRGRNTLPFPFHPPGSSQGLLLVKPSQEPGDSGGWEMQCIVSPRERGKNGSEGKRGPGWHRVYI